VCVCVCVCACVCVCVMGEKARGEEAAHKRIINSTHLDIFFHRLLTSTEQEGQQDTEQGLTLRGGAPSVGWYVCVCVCVCE
jgi:hypothetical protein